MAASTVEVVPGTSEGPGRRRDVLELLGVPLPGDAADPRGATGLVARRLFAATRLLITPVLLVCALVAPVVHPLFWLLMVIRLGRAGNVLAAAIRVRLPEGARFADALDTLLGAGLVLTTGGSDSPTRIVLIGLPLVAGFLVPPRVALEILRSCLVAYGLGVLPDLLRGEPGAAGCVAGFGVVMLFVGVCSLVSSFGRGYLTQQLATTERARRRLLNDGLTQEDGERRTASQRLHADALQLLLAAAQDLAEGDRDAVGRARQAIERSVRQLRDTVRDLHPAALRHSGLQASVAAALAHRLGDVRGVAVAEDATGEREALLLAVVRELADALALAGADRAVAARVHVEETALVLTLDASGPADVAERLGARVARTAERVEADGGTLAVGADGAGAVTVTARICRGTRTGAPPAQDPEDLRRVSLVFASTLWLGVFTIAGVLAAADGTPLGWALAPLLAAVALHLLALVRAVRGHLGGARAGAAASILALLVVVDAQGGFGSEAGALAVTVPFLLVLAVPPRDVAWLGGLLAVASVPVLALGTEAGAATGAMVAWAVLAGLGVAAGRQRMRLLLAGLEAARRRILHESLAAADAERRRLSEQLHDGPLQDLMAAGQDLDQALGGDPDAADYARDALASGVLNLRDVIADLHPPALDHGGLRPALEAVVTRARQRARFDARIEVGDGADGHRDDFLLEVVRELITNVRKHAGASRLTVRVQREREELLLTVEDDGVGMAPDRPVSAVLEGHIGLAATRERVEADGGALHVASVPGEGTRVEVRVPVAVSAQARRHVARSSIA